MAIGKEVSDKSVNFDPSNDKSEPVQAPTQNLVVIVNNLPVVSPIPSPSVSTTISEAGHSRSRSNRRVRFEDVKRPKWLWTIAVTDIIFVVTTMTWTSSIEAAMMMNTDHDELKEAISKTDFCISQILQFLLGLMLMNTLCIRNEVLLAKTLRIYLLGSYILLGTILLALVGSIPTRHKNAYENWRRMFCAMISLVIRLPVIVMIREFLIKFHE